MKKMLLLFEIFGLGKDLDSHIFDILRNLFTTPQLDPSPFQQHRPSYFCISKWGELFSPF